jgi:hypothetical protein
MKRPSTVRRILRPLKSINLSQVFFFGTLMVPQILTRVLDHKGPNLTFQDAVLPVRPSSFVFPEEDTDEVMKGYVRHCVRGADYPGIIPLEASKRLLKRYVRCCSDQRMSS